MGSYMQRKLPNTPNLLPQADDQGEEFRGAQKKMRLPGC